MGLAQDNENLDFDEKSLFAISESDAIDAVAPIRIILAIGRLADSFLFIYLFTAVTYVIYYVHNRSFLFLNLNISVEIRSITNTLLRSIGTFATKQYQPKTLISRQAQKKSVILLINYADVAFWYVL